MITIYNSNIDFDLDSSNSILLSNSNLVFKTRGLNRMTIMDTGNIGIGLENPSTPLDVIGAIKSSGMITSTGAGFTGRGDNLTNIPLDGIPQLIPTLALLRGDTSNTSSNIELNISGTSNIIINRILLETGYGSNYTSRINSELNTRTDNTSNYVLSTSNILVGRIRTEIGLTSNYVLSASNNLINKADLNDTNASNYVLTASNNLIRRENLNDGNASNYILTASNNLINKIRENDNNSSNYNLTASNNLINKIKENDNNSSNYNLTASNNLINKIRENDNNSSNYILTASNNLINKIRENDNNASNYILTASNNLINKANLNDSNSSNYVSRITSFLIDYNNLINRPDGAVSTNNANTCNYVLYTSNNAVNRIIEEVGRGSNYTIYSSNNLVNRVIEEVGRGSNYTLFSSNNLVNRIIEEVGRGSNYTLFSSNNLVNCVIAEVGRGSNYTMYSSNDLVNRVVAEVGRGSNYTIFSSNNLVNRVVDEVGFGSNYSDRVGGFGSNYADRVGVFGSNYTDRVGVFGSNYILSTSNILVGRILTETGFTSNYTKRLNDIAMVSSQWITNSSTIYYNSGNIGIGTTNPINNVHIYSCNNTNIASAKLTIQEANTSNLFSAYPNDILSVPTATIATTLESTIDKYMIFTYTTDNTGTGQNQYSITLPENYSCDILMVGGGGGGGGDIGGGGGGGAVLYGSNMIIPAGSYNIKVGAGGSGTGQNGYSTEGFGSICLGGGGAKNKPWESSGAGGANNGNMGGSGGGGKSYNIDGGPAGAGGAVGVSTKSTLLASATLYNGNVGGAGSQLNNGDTIQSGGGGGAGTVGSSGKSLINPSGTAAGGDGILINVLNIPATNVYWAGGGGGAGYFAASAGNGGLGGGGAGTKTFFTTSTGTPGASGYSAASGMNAGTSTGSGGGGGAGQGTANYPSNGGNGGSGIIVIRYRQIINMKGTPEMQLVIGNTIASGGSNYKIGNYDGDFQIKTSTSNVDTTSLIIQNTANVGIGTNVITSKLHLYDSTSNAILTIQDNTSVPTLIVPTTITASVVSPATLSVINTTPSSFVKQIALGYDINSIDSSGFTGQTSYTLTIPEDINVDILVVAGGGAGGFFGGGGGGGQVLLTTNYNIAAGTSITVNVGKGGVGNNTAGTNGQNGFNSSITIAGSTFTANGGGGGGSRSGTSPFNAIAGSSGGSGGGSSTGDIAPAAIGGVSVENTYTNWRSFGYNGGIGSFYPGSGNLNHYAGGGGGSGNVGGTGVYFNNTVAAGGDGVNLSDIFGSTQGAGGWFGGGGGGINSGTTATTPAGGAGGGGRGATSALTSQNGTATSGGGGGGTIASAGANGGSGVVIIRYRQRNREGNAEIQLIKGASVSAGYTNYKLGNYGGEFQIKSSLLGTDTNRLVIGSSGNLTLNGSLNATSYLLNGAPFSIATEVGNASNYVLSTSNILVNRVVAEVGRGSNYVLYTSNILAKRATDEIGYTSNYTERLDNRNSNYVLITSNILAKRATDEIGYTSNYVLITSNYFANRVSSQWTDVSSGIYYNTLNVGIGTTNPVSKLHIFDNVANTTTLTIQNEFISPTEIVIDGATSTTIGNINRIIMFPYSGTGNTKDYTFTTTEALYCDILIVGGGGGGGGGHGGGGGAGQLILIHQATLNGTYTIKVGKGGNGTILTSGGSVTSAATKGNNSEFGNTTINVIAEGGGANGGSTLKDGGSGAGGDGHIPDSGVAGKGLKNTTIDTFSSGTVYSRGNDGGDGGLAPGQGGGGGGAGATGTTGGNNGNSTIGHGGDGLSGISAISYDFKTNFGNYGKLETDGNYWFAGGGAGGIYYTTTGNVSNGGKGGGGSTPPNGINTPHTGGIGMNGTGGGGAGGSAHYGNGGDGGSGIVIIRYLTSQSSSIELIRGTSGDANVDYKIGNYAGDLKIISSISGTDTDRLVLNNNGNLTLSGSLNATSYLLNGAPLSIATEVTDTSNILVNRVVEEVGRGSNYVLYTSNILAKRATDEIGYTSNYTERLDNRNSNYVLITSNILVNRVVAEVDRGSNYVLYTSNNLAKRTTDEIGYTSNYVLLTSNYFANRVSSQWTDVSSGIYYNTLNVGIGTTNPLNILQVGAGGRLRIANATTDWSLIGTSDADAITNTRIVVFGNTHATNAGNIQYVAPTSTGAHIFYTTNTQNERVCIANNGNVGIGTTNPSNKLHLYEDIANNTGLTIQNNAAVQSTNTTSFIEFIRGTTIDANTDYKIGNYGGDLRIKSSISNADIDRFIIQSDGAVQFNNVSGTSMATISSVGDLWARGSITNNSDNRIKKDIEDIDYENALRMILAIKPKTYKYIDGDETSDSRIYGFIAQQIRDIIPDATELHKDFLPNIMKCAICNDNRIYLDLTEYNDLPLNEDDRRINIRFKNGRGDNFNIIEVKKEYFIVDKKHNDNDNSKDYKKVECPNGEVFVYGYEVRDFHKLTKDYIFTLNVSATQELHRYIEKQNIVIKSYGERIKELEEKIDLLLK
jgi:hypothetical protein